MQNVALTPRLWGVIRNQKSLSLVFSFGVVLVALFSGITFGAFTLSYEIAIIGCMAFFVMLLLRFDELIVGLIIAVHLYIDFYLALHLVGILMALVLLLVYYFGRSGERPWTNIRPLWLWVMFLILTISPAIQGGITLSDLASYYPSDILGAFLMFWLGTVIVRDRKHLRRLFKLLAALGTLIAIHTIVQYETGVFLFGSQHFNDYLLQIGNYQIIGSDAYRSGSFFVDPNLNGTFLAMMIFLPLGLFFESTFIGRKVFYLCETGIILLALLFAYSNGAWIGFAAGIVIFILLVGRKQYSFYIVFSMFIAVMLFLNFFPKEVELQLQHASNPHEVILRVRVWQVALQTIKAFPLTGVGLGHLAYSLHTQQFSISEDIVYSQPHDSYLEWAAMAGIPVLLVFIALLLFALWQALSNWIKSDVCGRPLIGGGIAAAVALSASSITIFGWTHPVLSGIGWLILGAIASPLLAQYLSRKQDEKL